MPGELSPWARDYLEREFDGDFLRVPVERIFLSEAARLGIGTYAPHDPSTADIADLVGSVDLAKVAQIGDEGDSRAWSWSGAVYSASRGLLEMIEILKVKREFLYLLLTLGLAVQPGALPVSPDRIERAIDLSGVAVEQTIAAFRSGRQWVAGPAGVRGARRKRPGSGRDVGSPAPSLTPVSRKRPQARRGAATVVPVPPGGAATVAPGRLAVPSRTAAGSKRAPARRVRAPVPFSFDASADALSGHSTQEKTIFSPGSAFTARRKSVTLPSGTSLSQASKWRLTPSSRKVGAASAACLR